MCRIVCVNVVGGESMRVWKVQQTLLKQTRIDSLVHSVA